MVKISKLIGNLCISESLVYADTKKCEMIFTSPKLISWRFFKYLELRTLRVGLSTELSRGLYLRNFFSTFQFCLVFSS